MIYESPHIDATIEIVKIDRTEMFSELSGIAPPEIYKRMVKTWTGTTELALPDAPESKADKERFDLEMNEIFTRYYLQRGTKFEMTESINQKIDELIEDYSAIRGSQYPVPSRKLFYLEKIFTNPGNFEQLGNLTRAIHEASLINRKQVEQFAKFFRNQDEWDKYIRLADSEKQS